MRDAIQWDRPMLRRFKRAYSKAIEAGHTQFTFEGNEFLVSYAKYLIEYLERRFDK